MNTATREEVYETVYKHLVELYKHLYFGIYNIRKISQRDAAVISYTAYKEMIQMAQSKYIDDYFERLKRNAI